MPKCKECKHYERLLDIHYCKGNDRVLMIPSTTVDIGLPCDKYKKKVKDE